MSKVIIEIDTDNEEFENNLWGGVNYAIQNWLATAPTEIVNSYLYDRNGNRVGTVNILKYDKKDFNHLDGSNITIKYNTFNGVNTLNRALVLGSTDSEVVVSCLGNQYGISYKDIIEFIELND